MKNAVTDSSPSVPETSETKPAAPATTGKKTARKTPTGASSSDKKPSRIKSALRLLLIGLVVGLGLAIAGAIGIARLPDIPGVAPVVAFFSGQNTNETATHAATHAAEHEALPQRLADLNDHLDDLNDELNDLAGDLTELDERLTARLAQNSTTQEQYQEQNSQTIRDLTAQLQDLRTRTATTAIEPSTQAAAALDQERLALLMQDTLAGTLAAMEDNLASLEDRIANQENLQQERAQEDAQNEETQNTTQDPSSLLIQIAASHTRALLLTATPAPDLDPLIDALRPLAAMRDITLPPRPITPVATLATSLAEPPPPGGWRGELANLITIRRQDAPQGLYQQAAQALVDGALAKAITMVTDDPALATTNVTWLENAHRTLAALVALTALAAP